MSGEDRGVEMLGKADPGTRPGDTFTLVREDGEDVTVRMDYTTFGDISRRKIHEAALLRMPLRVTVREDPERPGQPLEAENGGQLELTWFEPATRSTMAELVDAHPERESMMGRLRLLMRFSVLERHPREFSRHTMRFVDAHEIIQWQDDSVTVIEHLKGMGGELEEQTFLPPLRSLAALMDRGDSALVGDSPIQRDREQDDLIDLGMIHRAHNGLVRRLPGNYGAGNHRHPDIETLLRPAIALTSSFREELDDRTPA